MTTQLASVLVSGEVRQNGRLRKGSHPISSLGRRRLLPQKAVGSSGLGDLLAPGGARGEARRCALLRAEAVLVLFFNFCQRLDGDSQEVKRLHTFWNAGKLL